MRVRLLLLGILTATAGFPAPPESADPSVVPLTLPGYTLRMLDVQKRVILQTPGRELEATVPVFIYYPAASRTEAVRLIRQARAGLLGLQAKREWSAAELRAILAQLQAGLGELEKESPP